ncbi:hypothetical protein FB446DRAFT_742710 [Lentinula raphanica]|uniref:Uncharacterized protein n=1 Tax=Lentinula raphanica TaxID=153919 RepID=A0AA38UEG3_9AGAR|nr:hypothetical protein C8R42DRAFT_679333 [Lentinula raphanica]KAJ3770803.1 hypothetical protein FB446DRAFT_742710 [Lentinula raphanica]KAJ3835022.1 hypothetical protein F5878DRAFT_629079 [Lentinula raphanica]
MSSKVSIINEPVAVNTMDLYRDFHLQFPNTEKHPSFHAPPPYTQVHAHPHFDQTSDDSSPHQCSDTQRCHASRLRRVILPAIVAMVSLGGLLVLSCISAGLSGVEGADGLLKRATDDNGTFVNNKLYLIIVFVGLFLVVILGICLSAWCCRGSFENPLCCPCYLCACCGGLACLECIGCGLCAEGIENA